MLFKIWLVLLLFESVCGQQHVWTDQHVINSLGDHGDRIADLEKLVKTLVSSHADLQQEVAALRESNAELLLDIKNITDSCLSVLKCSSTYQSSTTQATVTTTTQSHMTNSTSTLAKSPSTTRSSSFATNATKTSTASTATSFTATTSAGQTSFGNCQDAISSTGTSNRTFDIRIGTAGTVVSVYCEEMGGDSWLVIQRRTDGSEDFNRNWQDYKNGFGDLNGEFWLGNEIIHQITSGGVYTLRIVMDDWGGNHKYAEYEHFDVGSEWTNYTLTVGTYHGTAGDSFHYPNSQLLRHNAMCFSTPDRDNDYSIINCAKKLDSGWWFNSCYSSNLNGKHLAHPYGQRTLGEQFGEPTLEGTGIEWYPYRHRQYSMRKVEMKIKLANSGGRLIGRK